jgi:TonB family protein
MVRPLDDLSRVFVDTCSIPDARYAIMRSWVWLVAVLVFGPATWAVNDHAPATAGESPPVGYVDCSNRDRGDVAPTYYDDCERVPFAGLACGRSVTVLERRGPWLKVGVANESPRYINAQLVSQRPDKSVPFDADSGVADLGPPNCPVQSEHRNRAPRPIYTPDPVYPEEARKKKIHGTVVLPLTIGTDGRPHDIKIEKPLGYGLDEKALEAVRQWRFQPALKDGKPVETQTSVSLEFKLF